MEKRHRIVETEIAKVEATVNKKLYCMSISLLLLLLLLLLLIFCTGSSVLAATEYIDSEVPHLPKVIKKMPVKYPYSAKKNGITGKVMVRRLIGTTGKAGKFEIVQSEPSEIFDDSALSALKYWQFRSGIKSGERMTTWVKVPFKFD